MKPHYKHKQLLTVSEDGDKITLTVESFIFAKVKDVYIIQSKLNMMQVFQVTNFTDG
jgi:hypothetical protein